MAQQIKKKFLHPDTINYFDNQIDAVEVSVSALEQSKADKTYVDQKDAELAQDIADLSGVVAGNFTLQQSDINGLQSGVSALTSSLNQEKLDRAAGDSSLQAQIDALNSSFATDSELASAVSSLEGQISSEASSRQSADLELQGKINDEKARIDAILLASEADKDSFAEIVQLINSVDTANDQTFAGYVLSNDARVGALENGLSAEQLARANGDVSTLSDSKAYTDLKISQIPAVDLSGYYTKSEVDSKDAVLSQDISDLEVYAQDIRLDHDSLQVYAQDLRSDVDNHEGRIAVLEAKTDGPNFSNGSVVVGAELGYIELDREYKKLMSCAVGRMAVHEGEDFTVSVVGGKTRITWIGSLVNPGGAEAIEIGDKVFFVGAY